MRVVVVDDETLARERLIRMLARLDDYTLVGEAENGEQSVSLCAELKPDIVLMDIRMPGMDGLQAARQICAQEQAPALIFCTAYGEYALEAFDVTATGYLLKPVNADKLAHTLAQARRLNRPQLDALQQAQEQEQSDQGRRHLTVGSGNHRQLLPLEDVRVLLAEQKYITVYHRGGEALFEGSLKNLEQEFPGQFFRIHRNALVALHALTGLQRDSSGSYSVKLADCDFTPQVSRRHLGELRQRLEEL